ALERRVKDAVARHEARLVARTEELPQQSILKLRRISEPETRRKISIFRRRQRRRNPWIARIHQAFRCAGKRNRLLAQNERRKLIVFFPPPRQHIPPQSVVPGKIWRNTPGVLRE